jgi:hypothetical protein
MGLLSINNTIQAKLANGESRVDIFHELSQASPSESGKFAYCINSIPTDELRKKYLPVNALLIIILAGYSILTVLSAYPINLKEPTLFIVIKILVPLILGYFAFLFHGGLYRIIAIWCAIDLFEAIMLSGFGSLLDLSRIMILFACVFLSWHIAIKVFPHLTLLGPRKDPSGHYVI